MSGSKLNGSTHSVSVDAISKKIYVKYMVCLRDKMILNSVLNQQGVKCTISAHGAIELFEGLSAEQIYDLKMALMKHGLILLDAENSLLIDKIINTIIETIHYTDKLPKINFTDLISTFTGSEQESILKIFSDVMGMSVLHFIIINKIERVKELLLYEDMPLREIAELLNYKNKHYLIAQFKKVTGLTPSYYMKLKEERLKLLKTD